MATAVKFPKTLGTCIDNLKKLVDEKAALKKKQDAEMLKLTDKIAAYENHLIDSIDKQKLDGSRGKLAQVRIVRKEIPTVNDWPKFYAYVEKNHAFDMLQKRLGTKAIEDRWDAGEKIPGVTTFTQVKLSVTKV